MPKILFAAAILFAATLSGCGKVKQLLNINVDIPYNYHESVPEIPGDSETTVLPIGGIALPFPAVPVATNSKQYVAQYGTATDLVLNVYLKSLSLQIETPPNRNFDFLDNIDVYLSSKTLPEVLIATQHNVVKGQNTLNFSPDTTVNLKSYFLEDTIYFRLSAHVNAVAPAGEELMVSTVFHMLANPLE